MVVFSLPVVPNLMPSPFPDRTRTLNPIFHRTHLGNLSIQGPFSRGNLCVARLGLGQFHLPDPGDSELMKDLFTKVEGFLYTIADAAVSGSPDTISSAAESTKESGDWLSGITNSMEAVLKVLKDGLSTLHVPYAYGFAIILLTVLVKAATFPLTRKQVESAMAMRSLAPQIKAIQERYAGDQERIQLETARIYKLAGINPLAGCLPTLATIPIWIGLYRALSNVANEGLLTEGFFWIPSLAGPTTIAARQNGGGTSWLFPFVDGHPPLGWSDTLAYLVLPVLLVISQYVSVQIMQPSQSNDPNMKNSQAIARLLPLMIGYFALSVPSGLSLYWLTNNLLSSAQQVWLQKLGGAKNPVRQLSEDITKKEENQVKGSLLKSVATEKAPRETEKPISGGPNPGERFKQIKEQEAKRRKQREEERKKAEAAVSGGYRMTNVRPDKEVNAVESDDSCRTEALDGIPTSSSGLSNDVVNGNHISLEPKEDNNPSVNGNSEGESLNNSKGKDNDILNEHPEKEEIVAATGGTDNKDIQEERNG